MQLSTASAISFETHQIHVRHGPASRRHTRAGDKAGAKTGLLDQPGAHPIAATRHHLNERPKRSANIKNAPRDPFGNTYPPLGLPQAIWQRAPAARLAASQIQPGALRAGASART